eukprot:766888-Hanusia_phi.AAC.3
MGEGRVKVRTVTSLVSLSREIVQDKPKLVKAIEECVRNNRNMEAKLVERGFEVQSLRISTNSFEDYMTIDNEEKFAQDLDLIKTTVSQCGATFFNFGPARSETGANSEDVGRGNMTPFRKVCYGSQVYLNRWTWRLRTVIFCHPNLLIRLIWCGWAKLQPAVQSLQM